MKLFKYMKDGGPESKSSGLFLIEIKKLCSIVLLKFTDGSRDAYHTHAFDAVSWVLKGKLVEQHMDGRVVEYLPSFKPIFTSRGTFHKVVSVGETRALTFRGPWLNKWREFLPQEDRFITLTHGRQVTSSWNVE